MEWSLRPYLGGDAAACGAVINAAIEDMEGLNPAARQLVRSSNMSDRLHRDLSGWTTLVATEADRIVGLGALDGAEITRVYVHPSARGTGIGTAIVHALESAARDAERRTVELDASPSSVAFWASLGYVATGRRTDSVGDAVFVVVPMTKTL